MRPDRVLCGGGHRYRVFGEILEQATRLGIPMQERVQHAGYYYHLAAKYTVQRLRVSKHLVGGHTAPGFGLRASGFGLRASGFGLQMDCRA